MATSTISGSVIDGSGTALEGIRVVARLSAAGYKEDNGDEISPSVETETDSSGDWSLALERNTNVQPDGTYWKIEVHYPQGVRRWPILVGASDQNIFAALVAPAPEVSGPTYLTQAAADLRYQTLGGLGSGSPTTLDNDDAVGAGSSGSASKADHQHALASGYRLVHVGTSQASSPSNGDLDVDTDDNIVYVRLGGAWVPVGPLGAWTAFTPTLSGGWALGNSTYAAKYTRIGRLIRFYAKITIGSTATKGTTLTMALPITAAADQPFASFRATFDDGGGAWYPGMVYASTTATITIGAQNAAGTYLVAAGITSTVPFTWATSDVIHVVGEYEAAA